MAETARHVPRTFDLLVTVMVRAKGVPHSPNPCVDATTEQHSMEGI